MNCSQLLLRELYFTMIYQNIIKPILFRFQAEKAHHLTFKTFKTLHKLPFAGLLIRRMFSFEDERLEKEVFGVKFKNPVGLAAGFDKDVMLTDELGDLGFGFIEIGTITPKGQEGNPKPRLFRLPLDESLINRMGFNNGGVEIAVERLKKLKKRDGLIVGGNIGKNKITPNDDAVQDYLFCLEALNPYVDYFVVNVSSPNTPNLRALQEKEPLKALLFKLIDKTKTFEDQKPILLKIAPDLTLEQLDDIIEIVEETKIHGIIATNTTISREGLRTSKTEVDNIGAGGLSGKILTERSTEVIKYIRSKSNTDIVLIGVGGIMTADDAVNRLKAGADLIQLYSGFVYKGPSLIKEINRAVLNMN